MCRQRPKQLFCLFLAALFALSSLFLFNLTACAAENTAAAPSLANLSAPVVHTFDVGISPEDYQTLVSDETEPRLSVSVSADGSPFVPGTIKLRGNSSKALGLALPTKRIPVQFNFDTAPLQETINNSCIKLINCITPFHLIAEYMAFDLFTYCGIPTPAHEFIFLRYNDVDFGLYLAVENVNKAFLAKHFSAPIGCLYKGAKGDESLPFSFSRWFGELRQIYGSGYDRVVELLNALEQGEGYEEYLDVDEVLRFFACTAAYGGESSLLTELSNYFLYDTGERFILIPWDLSEAFASDETRNGIDNFYLEYWATAPACPLFGLLMQDENNRERYHTYLRDILDNFLTPEKAEPYFQSLAALLVPYLAKDRTILINQPCELPVVPEEGFGSLGSLLSTLAHTYDNLTAQLQGSQQVFYVNPAHSAYPSIADFNRLVSSLLDNSPTADLTITDKICENYSIYCNKAGLPKAAANAPLATAAALAVFLAVLGAVFLIARQSKGGSRQKKRAASSEPEVSDK